MVIEAGSLLADHHNNLSWTLALCIIISLPFRANQHFTFEAPSIELLSHSSRGGAERRKQGQMTDQAPMNADRPGGVHRAAAAGFEQQSQAYRQGRPSYHPNLVDRLVARYHRPGSGPEPAPLVELGAGTGIFTAQLAAAGVSVVAVEPVEAMRAALVETLGPQFPGLVTAIDGTAERLPFDDRGATTIVASQSFHWFDHRAALDEIARVLAPGGHLLTVWNVRDNRVPWVAACTAAINRHAGDTPRYHTMEWRRAIDGDRRFSPVDEFAVANPSPSSPEGVADRVRSTSFVGALDAPTRAELLDEVARIVAPLGKRFDYPYTSELQAWRPVDA
jgi:SAM-dependent methyltransferase